MLFRRISRHFRSQDWLALALDFLIVILGVFLCLQAQDWNRERADRNQERVYLDRLTEDFAVLDQQIGQCLAVYSNSIEAINLVSRTVSNLAQPDGQPLPGEQTLANALLRITAEILPAGRSATFVEMLSAGDLSILRNAALRQALVSYDQRAQVNREHWRTVRDEVSTYYRPLYGNVDIEITLGSDGYSAIRDYDLRAMADDPAFRAMLNVAAGAKANTYALCQRQDIMIDTVRDLLDTDNPSAQR